MDIIGKTMGVQIPFGAGESASKLAKTVVSEQGRDYFRTVGKANFRL